MGGASGVVAPWDIEGRRERGRRCGVRVKLRVRDVVVRTGDTEREDEFERLAGVLAAGRAWWPIRWWGRRRRLR